MWGPGFRSMKPDRRVENWHRTRSDTLYALKTCLSNTIAKKKYQNISNFKYVAITGTTPRPAGSGGEQKSYQPKSRLTHVQHAAFSLDYDSVMSFMMLCFFGVLVSCQVLCRS